MTGLAFLVVVVPVASAAALAGVALAGFAQAGFAQAGFAQAGFAQAGVRHARWAGWLNVAACALTFGLACGLPWTSAFPRWALADPLAIHMVVLTAGMGLTAAWFDAFHGAANRGGTHRFGHALFQALLATLLLALLADNAAVTWLAISAAMVLSAGLAGLPGNAAAFAAGWKLLVLGGAGLGVALFGTVVLALAARPALGAGWAAVSWSALPAASPDCDATLLNLAFVFLLLGYGTLAALAPLHAWLPDALAEAPPPAALLSASMLNVAVFVILRLRGVMDGNGAAIAPGGPMMALGLASVAVAAVCLARQADPRRFLAFAAVGQSGLAVFAFGLGGAQATFAGLLQLTAATLVRAAAVQCDALQYAAGPSGDRAVGLTLAAAMVALAGLPPFGLFTGETLLLLDAVRQQPVLALAACAGSAAIAWSVVARVQRAAPAMSGRAMWPPLAGAWVNLLLAAMLGFAMPAGLAAWLRGIAAAAP